MSKLIKIEDENGNESTKTTLEKANNSRGFGHITFTDRYGQICSLQDSSLATEAAVWLGVDNTGPQLEGPNKTKKEQVMCRMHLTQEMVKQLLPFLQLFAEKGEYIANMEIEK